MTFAATCLERLVRDSPYFSIKSASRAASRSRTRPAIACDSPDGRTPAGLPGRWGTTPDGGEDAEGSSPLLLMATIAPAPTRRRAAPAVTAVFLVIAMMAR